MLLVNSSKMVTLTLFDIVYTKISVGRDLMTFRYDTQHLPPQTQLIIRKRDENEKLLSDSFQKTTTSLQKLIHPISIFMRLGHDKSSNLNGIQTMKVYEKFCNTNGTTWFSTDSHAKGMAARKISQFIDAINNENVVEIYFAIGKKGAGNNDIQYKAEVADICSDPNGIYSPDKLLTPNEWIDDKNKIWIKIINLVPYTQLTTKDFKVASSGNTLADSIAHSQHHFGYIIKK